MTVFDPVVKEVVSLVLGQIDATQQAVKAVLLVGGFGQNTFLRDSIRQAIAPQGIEVMQSPNG
jgi:tRNA A37 threonylcarbamoyltransferase TsaD